MRTHQAECETATSGVLDFVDLTEQVQAAVAESGVEGGQATVFCPDPSCSIVINEHETGLLEDIRRTVGRLGSNGASTTAVLGSSSVVLPVRAGRLHLGVWQRVLLVELEGGSSRSVVVQIVGE